MPLIPSLSVTRQSVAPTESLMVPQRKKNIGSPAAKDLGNYSPTIFMKLFPQWGEDSSVQQSYVSDLVRIVVEQRDAHSSSRNEKLVRIVLQVDDLKNPTSIFGFEGVDEIYDEIARRTGIDEKAIRDAVQIVETMDVGETVWAADNGWATSGDVYDQNKSFSFKSLPIVSNLTLEKAAKFQRNHGYCKVDKMGLFQGSPVKKNEIESLHALGKKLGIPVQTANSYLEGGNILPGTLPNGEAYAVVGRDSLIVSAFHFIESEKFSDGKIMATAKYLDSKGLLNEDDLIEVMENIKNSEDGQDLRSKAKCMMAVLELTKDEISRDLGIKRENLLFIDQADYHNDMQIRLLGAGEIMINNHQESIKLIDRAIEKFSDPVEIDTLKQLRLEEEKLSVVMDPILQKIEDDLKKFENIGIRVIKAPGSMGDSEERFMEKSSRKGSPNLNFINSLLFMNTRGESIYVTNATSLPKLAEEFEIFMHDLGVDKVYYVGKDKVSENLLASEASINGFGALACRTKCTTIGV